MNKVRFFCQNQYLHVFPCVVTPLNAYATAIIFAGQSDDIGLDKQGGTYAGTPIGTDFFGVKVSLEGNILTLHRLSRSGRYRGNNTIVVVREAGGAGVEKYFSVNIRGPPSA
jgi:hypothetical protein